MASPSPAASAPESAPGSSDSSLDQQACVQSASHGCLSSLWDPHASAYSLHRPSYPPAFLDSILRFAGFGGGQRGVLAVDVGCGSGQVTVDLAAHFARVVGLDPSASQLAHARQAPGLEYREAPAEATGLPQGCADLITAATCLHWFDLPSFYQEARRILKPGGTLAAWAYFPSSLRLPDCPAADQVLQRFCRQATWAYFHPALQRCMERGYSGLEPSTAEFTTVSAYQSQMEQAMSLDQLVNYVSSWSCRCPFVERHGRAEWEAALEGLREDLAAALAGSEGQPSGAGCPVGSTGGDPQLRTVMELEVLLAKGPAPL